jgi:hypothetical protein
MRSEALIGPGPLGGLMLGRPPGPRKLDLTKGSLVQAHANGLWPHLTDVARWPSWLRSPNGRHGLASAVPLPTAQGSVDPLQPELGLRWQLAFTNGFEGEFRVTYWVEPAQISLGLVPGTAQGAQGVEGLIFDLDFFPQPDGSTKLWFGATVLLARDARPGLFAAWPKRTIASWVEGFHRRAIAEGPALAGGVRTRKQMEAAARRPARG